MKVLPIAIAISSAFTFAASASTLDPSVGSVTTVDGKWHIVMSNTNMPLNFNASELKAQNLRFKLDNMNWGNAVFDFGAGKKFLASGFDTVSFENETVVSGGNQRAIIWNAQGANFTIDNTKHVVFGTADKPFETGSYESIVMAFGTVNFGTEVNSLESFSIVNESPTALTAALMTNSSISNTAQDNANPAHISIYADTISIQTKRGALYSMVAPMAENSTQENTGTITLVGNSISLNSSNYYAVLTASAGSSPKVGTSNIDIRAKKDISISGLSGIYLGTGTNKSNLNIQSEGNVSIKGTSGQAIRVESGSAGSAMNISGDTVDIAGGRNGISLNSGDFENTISAKNTINISGSENAVAETADVQGIKLTLKSVDASGQVNVNTFGKIALSEGTLALGNAVLDPNGSPINVGTLAQASGYGESTILVTSDEEGSISIGKVEKGFVKLEDKNGALTEKYGSPAAARARIEEKILSGEIQKNYTTISGAASDMTGAWSYDPVTGVTDWEFGESDSPTLAAAKHFNAATLSQWRYENNHLYDRLGDIRYAKDRVGSWARVYGMDAKVSDSVSTNFKANSVQVGVDFPVASNWVVGAAFGYTNGKADFTNGAANSDGYTFALYGSASFDCGGYVDVIGRVGRILSDVDVTTVTPFEASYDNTTYGLSAEIGYRWDLSDTFYVVPQAEVSYGYVKGDDYTASNDIYVAQDDFTTLVGRAGFQLGANFAEKRGTVYLTASVNHEFQGETEATASRTGAADQHLKESLDGTWFSYGVGAQFNVTDSTAFYGSLTRANGSDYQENFRYSAGLRIVW